MQRKTRFATVVACAIMIALVCFSGCTALLGDFEITTNADASADTAAGKDLGASCAAAGECASAQCVDGVCCEAACDGVCETCNLPGSAGKCMPVPDGEDPANECPTTPLPDAGLHDSGIVFEDAGDAGDASDDADASTDAGRKFDLPEAGITTENNQCAGKCNGKRACSYPGSDRTCGTIVCGNRGQQGRAACDGAGHCLFGIEDCEAYSCPDGKPGCVKTCAAESDCLPTHFCDAVTSSCKPKLANGSGCGSVTQCRSGFCVENVCCNSECNGFPGATCTKSGEVGTCRCTACPTGPCQLWYQDEDGDGFGDKYGTLANLRARPGCVGGPPPAAGFVDNKNDCYDGPGNSTVAAAVRPNQTGFYPQGAIQAYTAPGQPPSYDYNCDGLTTKETPEFLNGSCGFCGVSAQAMVIGCSKSTTSCTNGQSAGLACGGYFCFPSPCTRCPTLTDTGFTTTVDCGNSATATNCGSCSNNTIVNTTYPTIQQRCR